MPRGPDPWGRRLEGREQVRTGLANRFASIPDVHYSDDRHWVAGDRGCSEWLLTGTSVEGEEIEVRGCVLFEFRSGEISRKDSYWRSSFGDGRPEPRASPLLGTPGTER